MPLYIYLIREMQATMPSPFCVHLFAEMGNRLKIDAITITITQSIT